MKQNANFELQRLADGSWVLFPTLSRRDTALVVDASLQLS